MGDFCPIYSASCRCAVNQLETGLILFDAGMVQAHSMKWSEVIEPICNLYLFSFSGSSLR